MATWACLDARVGDLADLASAARDQVLGQLDATTCGELGDSKYNLVPLEGAHTFVSLFIVYSCN
ncbi:hypothetical protein Syun_025363 [Stephania yunnanensis]|uniref:Uncharacterized protein n=1 Tax=Stephania yunnanensis TaxID=152371 RepID=A0AAP0EYP2_9MAGN